MAHKKAKHYAHRAAAAARHAAGGAKGSAMVAVGGGVAFFAAEFAVQHVDALKSAWWATPVAMGVGGHFLRRKYPTMGGGLLGAAGYALAQNWRQKQMQDALAAQQPGGAKGLDGDDAGALENAYRTTGEGAPNEGAPSAGALENNAAPDAGELDNDAMYLAA